MKLSINFRYNFLRSYVTDNKCRHPLKKQITNVTVTFEQKNSHNICAGDIM